MKLGILHLGLAVASVSSACTFYTACPTPQPAQPAAGSGTGGGANGGTGNTSDGGADDGGGTGGSVAMGGAPPMGKWVNETFNLKGLDSECGNLSQLSSKPDEDMLIVSVAQQGLFHKRSSDTEWTPLGQGKGSEKITNRGTSFLYDPEHPKVFWESGIYNGGGIYRTDDNGDTFKALNIIHNDYVSVDFTDPDRQTLLASGHEQDRKFYKSTDGGETFVELGDQLPDEVKVCPQPVALDAEHYLLGCGSYGGGDRGIYSSTDGGDSWKGVSTHGGGAAPLLASDGTIYWASEGTEGIVTSTDQGATWDGPFGGGELAAAKPVELPDGRVAALGNGRILVTANGGNTWRVVTTAAPFQPLGVAYSAEKRAFYVWHFSCDVPVPNDAIMAYDWDYETE
ncbi:MAG TPA: hypothetical protein VEQ59_05685 [Polyangiaceae bacterium]|nr:hypothetical protein [Polyangiaceae bacterium]